MVEEGLEEHHEQFFPFPGQNMESVSIVDVTADNASLITPRLLDELASADFVAIDQELSGLGNTAGRGRLEVNRYYTKLREAALTRRVISLGISVFKSVENSGKSRPEACDPLNFSCTSYNVLLMPDCEFELDGSARRFLVTHGFDLNRWAKSGILYSRRGSENHFMDSILKAILTTKASIVFHNGLTDLAYFYQSDLPKNNLTFTADIADMFGGRLFDTKVLCNKALGWRIHSLEYCYKKSQRISLKSQSTGQARVLLQQGPIPTSWTDVVTIPTPMNRTEFAVTPKVGVDVCPLVYHFGFCNAFKTDACQHSVEQHQMDVVLDVEEQRRGVDTGRGNREKSERPSTDPIPSEKLPLETTTVEDRLETAAFCAAIFRPPDLPPPAPISPVPLTEPLNSPFQYVPRPKRPYPSSKGPHNNGPVHPQRLGVAHFTIDNCKTYNLDFGLHSAGFDAFMTGHVFAVCLALLGSEKTVGGRVIFKQSDVTDSLTGRVHMTGKSECYAFVKSEHVKVSMKHAEKIGVVRDNRVADDSVTVV